MNSRLLAYASISSALVDRVYRRRSAAEERPQILGVEASPIDARRVVIPTDTWRAPGPRSGGCARHESPTPHLPGRRLASELTFISML